MIKPEYLGLSILEINKTLIMNVGMITLNQSINTMQNYGTWIQIAFSLKLKLKIFIKILLMMWKKI